MIKYHSSNEKQKYRQIKINQGVNVKKNEGLQKWTEYEKDKVFEKEDMNMRICTKGKTSRIVESKINIQKKIT